MVCYQQRLPVLIVYIPKSELPKVADVQTHVCTKFLSICAKLVLLNAKQEKQALFMILAQFDKIPSGFTGFYGILSLLFRAKLVFLNAKQEKRALS